MKNTKSLIAYRGRVQALTSRLRGRSFEIAEENRWGILKRGLLAIYKKIVRFINIYCEGLSYSKLIAKLQEIFIEDIGDPTVPLERKSRVGKSSTALTASEKGNKNYTKRPFKFKGKCNWSQKQGHMSAECRSRLAGKPKIKHDTAVPAAIMVSEDPSDGNLSFKIHEKDNTANLQGWVIDSGASHHYSKNGSDIGNCKEEEGMLTKAGSKNLEIKRK